MPPTEAWSGFGSKSDQPPQADEMTATTRVTLRAFGLSTRGARTKVVSDVAKTKVVSETIPTTPTPTAAPTTAKTSIFEVANSSSKKPAAKKTIFDVVKSSNKKVHPFNPKDANKMIVGLQRRQRRRKVLKSLAKVIPGLQTLMKAQTASSKIKTKNLPAKYTMGVSKEERAKHFPDRSRRSFVKNSVKKAIEGETLKAINGDCEAQFKTGLAHQTGVMVPRNSAEALKWYTLAAEQGSAPAMSNIGSIYSFGGHGVKKDSEAALHWFTRAAKAGDVTACCHLGNMYYYGNRGVACDKEVAKGWYKRCADQGSVIGTYKLRMMEDEEEEEEEGAGVFYVSGDQGATLVKESSGCGGGFGGGGSDCGGGGGGGGRGGDGGAADDKAPTEISI